LVVLDLDNVLIDTETIDEIAEMKGIENEISEITARAMRGEIPYETSIRERVKMLEGIDIDEINKKMDTLPFNPGAVETATELKNQGYITVIITGGFDVIALRIKEKLNVDYAFYNTLEVKDGKLTGEVSGPLVTRDKLDVLKDLISDLGITLDECAAVGDGANDLELIKNVKLGIAYNAKPIVKENADKLIDEKDLRKVLDIMADEEKIMEKEEFVEETATEEAEATEEVVEEATEEVETEAETEEEIVESEEEATEEVEEVADEDVSEEDVVEEAAEATAEEEDSEETTDDTTEEEAVEESEEAETEVESEEVEAEAEEVEAEAEEEVKEEKPEIDLSKLNFNQLLSVKRELEDELTALKNERDQMNENTKTFRQERDELNQKLKDTLQIALDKRNERDEINKQVRENKDLRNECNEELKKVEWSSGKKEISNIQAEINKIDKTIQTKVLDIRKENELVKRVSDLTKQLKKIQSDEEDEKTAEQLKEKSEMYHQKVVELSDKAQVVHEEMIDYFNQIDGIREEADAKHQDFINSRKAATAKHEEVKAKLSEIKKVNKCMDQAKSKSRGRKSENKRDDDTKEKEAAEEIFQKFKDGKKLTTDEFLLLQKYNIV
jgi:phosphoserine phosphatase